MKALVYGLLIVLILLHQDFWWWQTYEPLVFGFLPPGLTHHIGISLAATALWFAAARLIWPAELEVSDADAFAGERASKGLH